MDNAAAAKTLSGFAYSDVNRLSQIKTQGQAGIRAAAQQFESLFIDMMMTSMRQAGSAFADGDYTSSDATKMQQEMLDHQWAVHISENGGIGLAGVIVKQLSGTLSPKHAASQLTMPKVVDVPAPEAANAAPAPAAPEPAPAIDPVAPEWTLGTLLATAPNAPAPTMAATTPAAPPDETVGAADEQNDADEDPALTVTNMGSKDSAFGTPDDFVAKVLPVLKNALAGTGLNPLMVLAQGALETGWGAHVIHDANGDSSHNLFNIKASGDWNGPAVEVSTVEFHGGQPVQQRDRFRAYDSVESAVRDYLSVLKGDPRYQRALDAAQDPSRFADELQKAGYATDPHYAAKIVRVLTGGALRAALTNLGR
jgi:flagellar protein FlgJ